MHAVGALLDGTPKRVRALHVWSAHAAKLAERASMLGIPVRREEPDNLGVPPHLAQGIAARIAPYSYVSLEDVIAVPDSGQGLLVALDSVTDTRNLGAILRSAGFFSAQGVVIPKDRAATVTPVTERIARGGAAIVPVAQVTNLARSLATIAEAGWTIVGTALDDTSGSLWDEDLSGPICFVLGAEDKGMRRLVRSRCDRVVSLEPLAPVQSLNVASFATLAMSEVRRQQR
ncbi:MAG: RNA methyltransferase [Myxococcales bacterium]|nr:RNA methyltransferase [Myxococcales bacterium]